MTATAEAGGLELFQNDEYDPDELFQTKALTFDGDNGGEREYAYPLTSFIPKATTPSTGTGIPPEAAYWIIPDINDVVVVRQLKMFETTFIVKVPAPFNTLYCRVGRDNRPNLTDFQDQIRQSIITQYKDKDNHAPLQQVYLLPVIRRYKGEWDASLAEVGITAYAAIKEAIVNADDISDGRVNLSTCPIGIWKSGKRETTVRFDKKSGVDVPEMVERFAPLMPKAREYVKIRSKETEEYLRKAWKEWTESGKRVEAGVPSELSAQERYAEAVMNLSTAQMRGILKTAGIDSKEAKTKPALHDLVLAHQDELEAEVLAANVPF